MSTLAGLVWKYSGGVQLEVTDDCGMYRARLRCYIGRLEDVQGCVNWTKDVKFERDESFHPEELAAGIDYMIEAAAKA